ncbi:pilus assembly protein PilM [Chloroflexota bacterium]
MAKKKVSLYIEDTDIKLLVTKGHQVEKWASLLLEPSLVRDGVIVDEDQVAESIKELLKLAQVKTKKVSVCLSGLDSIFRIIVLPDLPQNLLPEGILNEARRVIPVPLEQVYISYQRVPNLKGETSYFLVAHPRNSTDTLVKTLNKAGLKPDIMDLAPLALARCANEPTAIIINSWLTYLDVIIMSDRLPKVIRSLSLPTESIGLEGKLPFIAEELARTIAFYNSGNPANQLDSTVPVFVCGDLAEAPDTWQALVSQKANPVSTLVPPIQYPETFSPCKFMVNIGLALKNQLPMGEDSYYSEIDYNALPEAYRPEIFNLTRILIPVAVIIGIGTLAYGGLLVNEISDDTTSIKQETVEMSQENELVRLQISSIKDDITEQDEAIAPLPGQALQKETQIESLETAEAKFSSMINGLSDGLSKTDADLKEVVDLLPVTIILNNVNYIGNSVAINGIATNEDDILSYARALRSSERFNDVVISSISEIFKQEYGEEIKMFSYNLLLI